MHGRNGAVVSISGKGFNLNSALLSFFFAVLLLSVGWVGKKTSDSNDGVIEIKATLPPMQKEIKEIKDDMKDMKSQQAKFVTDEQLKAVAAHQREEFTKLLKQQLKIKGRLSPGTGAHDNIDDN